MNKIITILIYIILIGVDLGLNSYLLYIFVLILFFLGDFSHLYYPRNNLVTPFLILSLYALSQFWQMSQRTVLEIGLLILGVLCFTFRRPYRVNIKKLNVCVGIVLLLQFFMSSALVQVTYLNYLNSDIGYESSMLSFIIPFFFYYWLSRNDKLFILINMSLVLIAGKRIALLACFVGVFYYLCKRWLQRKWFPFIMISVNLLYLFFSFLLAEEFFDDLCFQWFGMSVNQLTMGRFELYRIVMDKVDIMDEYRYLYGIGLGNTENYLILGINRLHNDVLKIFFEFGIIVFCIFFYYIYNQQKPNQWGYILIWNVLLMTDNTLTYVPVIFAIGILIDSESKSIGTREKKNMNILRLRRKI